MFGRKKSNGDEPEWDPTFEPLMKLILNSKKHIKVKSASEVGKKKVDYFRGKDFKKFVTSNEDVLKRKCSAALKAACDGKVPEDDKDVTKLGAELIRLNFCYKAIYKPINPSAKTDDGSEKKARRWPDRLARDPRQNFDPEGYYVVTYSGGSGLQHFLLALIIVAVLLACMFPVWPMWAKIGVWYLSVLFLVVYFGLLILRMLVFTAFWIVGFDFWIFPNLNDEYCGFLDSFQPLYTWEKRNDDAMMLLVRFGSLAITAVAIQQIAETHSISDVQEFFTSSYIDVLDWGVEKLTALPGSDRQALPSLESLSSETDENGTNETDLDRSTAAEAAEDDDDDDKVSADDVVDMDAAESAADVSAGDAAEAAADPAESDADS